MGARIITFPGTKRPENDCAVEFARRMAAYGRVQNEVFKYLCRATSLERTKASMTTDEQSDAWNMLIEEMTLDMIEAAYGDN
jgi:hypothetical protein